MNKHKESDVKTAEERAEYAARMRERLNREKIPQHDRYIYNHETGEIVHIK